MESEDEEQRSSQLNDEDLENLEREAEQKGTAAAAKWSMKKLEAWLTKRKVNVNLATVRKEELAALLHRFYGELKSEKNGKAVKSQHSRRDQIWHSKRAAESSLGSSTHRKRSDFCHG